MSNPSGITIPEPFDRLPSLITELLSGLLFVGGGFGAIKLVGSHPVVTLLLLATAGSLLYEMKLDKNGFSLKDVLQREAGILLGVFLVALFHRL